MDLPFLEIIQRQPLGVLLCSSLGFFSLLRLSFFILHNLYIYLYRPEKNLREYGRWAIITGPTDGIGKEMAFQLARRGHNLILVGRNPAKMEQVAGEIRAEVAEFKLKTVLMDFAEDLSEGIRALEEAIEGIEVGILVNNAGITQARAMYVHEISEETWWNIVKVNLIAPTFVTAAVLPGMITRKKGAIINMGSAASVIIPSYPLYSVYAATKRYISHLSKSLHLEYKPSGIHVQCQVPCYVATKMIPRAKSSVIIATTAQYVHSSLRFIGYEAHCIPYWTHALQYYLLQLCPADSILDWYRYNLTTKSRNRRKT